MRKVVISLIMILAATLTCFSGCNRGVTTKTLSREEANNVFLQVKNRKPIFCESVIIQGVPYLIGAFEKQGEFGKETVISKLASFAGNWQEVSHSLIEKEADQELQNDFEIVTIEGKKYLYFSRLLLHQRDPCFIEFILYSPIDNQIVALKYSGEWVSQKVEGKFDNLSYFKNKLQLLKFLENKAAKCQLIYRPTAKDFNINSVKNFAMKWLRENPDAYATSKGGWTPISFCYYSEKMFSDKPLSGTAEERRENRNYIIATSFAGPVLGYDKTGKKYFVIWVPEGMGSAGAWGARSYHAQFKTDSMIVIKNIFHEMEINLQRKQFRVTSHDEAE